MFKLCKGCEVFVNEHVLRLDLVNNVIAKCAKVFDYIRLYDLQMWDFALLYNSVLICLFVCIN